ncbi:ABC transporter permease [Gracilibacillus halophilus]|uniref:ABC transporter permease n=1 Tax=Gracilibacillus halophilus TaxID=470864 RepID=UPI0003A2D815
MNKFWTVFSHTFVTKLKSKPFIWTTVLFLGIILLFANIQSIIKLFDSEDTKDQVAVVTEQTEIFDQLTNRLQETEAEIETVSFDGSIEEAQEAVDNGEFVGILDVSVSENGLPQATYLSDDLTNQAIPSRLNSELEQIKVTMATNQAGLDQDVVASIYEPMNFETELFKRMMASL